MKKKLVFKNTINWGWLIIFVTVFIILINIVFAYYLIQIIPIIPLTLILAIPAVILDVFVYPVVKFLALKLINKENHNFKLYTSGMEIKGKFLEWKNIKSISFNTGRVEGKRAFFMDFKLPGFQKIFILDKEGKEYSCVIDVDYFLKKNRKENNLRKIRELLLGMDRISLISDWAQKY